MITTMAAPLLRTNTAPVFQHSGDGVARLQGNMALPNSARASQLSGSTAFASSTSLNSIASAPTVVAPQNGTVVPTGNIINQKADASRSLYQICVSLKQRLAQVPGFDGYPMQLNEDPAGGSEGGPVESLWSLLRTGEPLLVIYNALQPGVPLQLDDPNAAEAKKSKLACYKFVQACLKDLSIPLDEMFAIRDLTGTDTTGFVKVTSVLNYVLDLADQRGLLLRIQPYPEDDSTAMPGSQMSYRDYIVKELVDTERKYVQDLENLHSLKQTLEMRGVIAGDVVHDIFLNINSILDFQRRFLIRVETTNSMPAARQEWGNLFVSQDHVEGFGIYQPFIANQRKAAQLATQFFDTIHNAEHPVAVDSNTLDGFLLKPMQRLVKYPLLLKDLMKKAEDEATRQDLAAGIAAAERVLQEANEAVERAEMDELMVELVDRVDNWRSHQVDKFGRLLLHGFHTVLTSRTEQEKDYEVYLFESILLCCKELSQSKSKDKKDKTRSTGPKIRSKGKLQLKGRIFMSNVTEVLTFAKPGSYSVQIWWKGDPSVENFVIKFQKEETMKKWAQVLDTQRKANVKSPQDAPRDFAWLRDQSGQVNNIANPYAQQDDDDDANDGGPTPPSGGPYDGQAQSLAGAMQRNISSSSLRQRSGTSDSAQSLAGVPRAAPARFPLPQPPSALSLQTQMTQQSPMPRGVESYFSPTTDSPASSRTSTTSAFPPSAGYPFPTPQSAGAWGLGDDYNRYTAPAMPRAPSRDGPSPINAYGMVTANGRNPRGPSLPAMTSQSAAQQHFQQQRSRSYSTPDINGQPMSSRRGTAPSVPAVPGIPAHLHAMHERHDSAIPRSHTNSPMLHDLPVRANTQSPSVQRERQYGGAMAQFPAQPIYPRLGTPSGSLSGIPPLPGPPPAGLPPVAPLSLADPSHVVPPPLGTAGSMGNPLASPELPPPTQLKVKVNCDNNNYFTLVVTFSTTYRHLVDRIDSKLGRFTTSTISSGNLKLRYRDEDGDFVTINSDEDVQMVISEWRENVRNLYSGGVGEIELFCVGDVSG